jgi:hypothetical protein
LRLMRGYSEKKIDGHILRNYYLDELLLLNKIHAILK